jgi:hypothetical protein
MNTGIGNARKATRLWVNSSVLSIDSLEDSFQFNIILVVSEGLAFNTSLCLAELPTTTTHMFRPSRLFLISFPIVIPYAAGC